MMNENNIVNAFYQKYDEDKRLNDRQGYVEYITTMKYIHKYLEPGMKIIEIGAGTGRYSLELAKEGYQVTAIELVERNIEVFKNKIQNLDSIQIIQGNAMNLECIADESMDITLSLGPMYHLFSKEHKRKALEEAIRVTKKGGIIMIAYCLNEATVLQYCFGKNSLWNDYQKGLLSGDFTWTANINDAFALVRPSDIRSLTIGYPVERIGLVATDGATRYLPDMIESMSDALYQKYIEYHFTICERQDLIGASNHVLDILQKK